MSFVSSFQVRNGSGRAQLPGREEDSPRFPALNKGVNPMDGSRGANLSRALLPFLRLLPRKRDSIINRLKPGVPQWGSPKALYPLILRLR